MQPAHEALASVVRLLATVDRPGDFYATGSLETSIPKIDVDGVGPLSFPVPAEQAEKLVGIAERAPYGRGGQTRVDPAVRRVWQLPAERVHAGPRWGKTLDTIVEAATRGLGVQGTVRAELYKLLVYDTGSFFLEHRDSEKTDGMFATLVVSLPSVHAGGELVVRHGDRSATLDLGTPDPADIVWAAFYADCLHELRPVTTGHRICLVYNLVRTGGSLAAPDHEATVTELTTTLRAYAGAKEGWPTKIALALAHHYTPAGLSFANLKNADRGVASVVVEAARRASCSVHLAMVSITETGSAEENHDHGSRRRRQFDDDHIEVIEVFDRVFAVEAWRTPDDRPAELGPIEVDGDELWPPDAIDEEKPDEQHYHEATGNEGAEYQRTYRRAALVLWPSDRRLAVVAQAEPGSTVPVLERLIEQDRQGALELARRIIDRWDPSERSPPSWRWGTAYVDPAKLRVRMLRCLVSLQAGPEIERFVARVVAPIYGRDTKNDALVAAMAWVEPARATAVLVQLVRDSTDRFPTECVDLLGRVVDAGPREVARAVAEGLVEVLPGNPAADPKRAWPPSVEPAFVVAVFRGLWRLGDRGLAERAAERASAWYSVDRTLLPAVRTLAPEAAGQPGWVTLRAACVDTVLRRVAEPIVPPTDLARLARWSCGCKHCESLHAFLASPTERTWALKAAEPHRRHVQSFLGGVDVDCETSRRTSPHTLTCTKNSRSHEARVTQRAADIGFLRLFGIA